MSIEEEYQSETLFKLTGLDIAVMFENDERYIGLTDEEKEEFYEAFFARFTIHDWAESVSIFGDITLDEMLAR